MNKRNDRDVKLLADTFHDDWSSGRAAEFAREAAAHARARRRLRRTTSIVSVMAVAGATVFFASRQRHPTPETPAPMPAVATAPRGYEVISDDEFLAQVRDRPVLVVKKENGSREFVLLANE